MVDSEVLDILRKYGHEEAELEKNWDEQLKVIKAKLLHELSKKEKEIKIKLEGVREIKNIFENMI